MSETRDVFTVCQREMRMKKREEGAVHTVCTGGVGKGEGRGAVSLRSTMPH